MSIFDGILTAIRTQESSRDRLFLSALDSEDAFAAWAQEASLEDYPPFVRASTYGRVWKWQEFEQGWRLARNDARRPVIMKGALWHLRLRRFGNVRPYSQEVCKRYFRRIRFTAFTAPDAAAMRERIRIHMNRRGHPYSEAHLVEEVRVGNVRCKIYFEGEPIYVTSHERRRLMRAKTAGQRDIKPELFEEFQRGVENAQLFRLTKTFKTLLKAPKEQQARKAAALLSERT